MFHMEKAKSFLSKNAMLVVLLFAMLLFEALLSGGDIGQMFRTSNNRSLFSPANLTNLISQNAYVVILATGMLLCILTGGNIDLSVGSIVILVGAISGIFIVD
jgi:putative multiple sugar transport system permease protein